MNKIKVSISWSGGKDSAFALYKILHAEKYEVVHLHTIINEGTMRVGMHGIRQALVDLQAERIGIPLIKIYLESSESYTAYEALMKSFYKQCSESGIEAIVFGDIFLEDLKKYREHLIGDVGLKSLFPLWKIDSNELISAFIDSDFKTLICSANAKFFRTVSLGKTITYELVEDLPAGVDPCGENGEFHTFVYDGPIFRKPVNFHLGEVVAKRYHYRQQSPDGTITNLESEFLFQDVLPID